MFIRRRDEPAGRSGCAPTHRGQASLQRLRVAQYIFSFNVELCGDFLVAWTSAPPNSAAPVFQAARGYEAYRINTPAQVLSGARSGVGGAIRVRTICMGWPQLGQRNGARGLTQGACATPTTMSAPIRPTRDAPKRGLPARQRTGSSSVAPLTQKFASVIVIASIEERPRAHDDAPAPLPYVDCLSGRRGSVRQRPYNLHTTAP